MVREFFRSQTRFFQLPNQNKNVLRPRFSELKYTGFFSTRQSFGSEKGSLNERMRQIVSSGPCGTGFVVPFDGIETNKTLTDNNTL